MTPYEIITEAHRICWRYKKSHDPSHSDTYTFNEHTLLEFARVLIQAEREACLNDIELERASWQGNRSGLGVMVCGYIMEAIKKRGMA
jgi:hypothetical protein